MMILPTITIWGFSFELVFISLLKFTESEIFSILPSILNNFNFLLTVKGIVISTVYTNFGCPAFFQRPSKLFLITLILSSSIFIDFKSVFKYLFTAFCKNGWTPISSKNYIMIIIIIVYNNE